MNNGKVVSFDVRRQVILWEPAAVVLDGKQALKVHFLTTDSGYLRNLTDRIQRQIYKPALFFEICHGCTDRYLG